MRLGDLDALLEEIGSLTLTITGVRNGKSVIREILVKYRDAVLHEIADAPTIDAVPVCRCWNCTNGYRCIDGYVQCSHPAGKVILMKGSDFCSYGVGKDGEDDGKNETN